MMASGTSDGWASRGGRPGSAPPASCPTACSADIRDQAGRPRLPPALSAGTPNCRAQPRKISGCGLATPTSGGVGAGIEHGGQAPPALHAGAQKPARLNGLRGLRRAARAAPFRGRQRLDPRGAQQGNQLRSAPAVRFRGRFGQVVVRGEALRAGRAHHRRRCRGPAAAEHRALMLRFAVDRTIASQNSWRSASATRSSSASPRAPSAAAAVAPRSCPALAEIGDRVAYVEQHGLEFCCHAATFPSCGRDAALPGGRAALRARQVLTHVCASTLPNRARRRRATTGRTAAAG